MKNPLEIIVSRPVFLCLGAVVGIMYCTQIESCARQAKADHRKRVVVANAFAVPIGVPVSPYAGYAYSSSQQQQQAFSAPPRSAEDILVDRLAEKLLGKLAEKGPDQIRALAARQTATGKSCAACHSKADASMGKPQLIFSDLSDAQRFAAIRAVASGRMPPGGKITAEDRGNVIQELASEPKAKAPDINDVPPPPPLPEGENQ